MTKIQLLLLFAIALFANSAIAQNPEPPQSIFAETITELDLQKHLTILTSDSLEGRETGTEGNAKAGRYIATHFSQLGLPKVVQNTYFQPVVFTGESWAELKLNVNSKDYASNWDFYSLAPYNNDLKDTMENIVFLGYGIEDETYSDYKKGTTQLQGKSILIYDGEPKNSEGVSLLTSSTTMSDWTKDFSKKLEIAFKYGVKNVFIIDGALLKNLDKYRNQLNNNALRLGDGLHPEKRFANSFFISTEIARNMIGKKFKKIVKAREYIEATGKSKTLIVPSRIYFSQVKKVRKLAGNNVLGFIEGSDPQLKNELVVVTAHYDHLGKRGDGIYRGADDDGSGTCAVMEIAEAFSIAKKEKFGPRRSILCMLVTGEEKGLLGSQYYANFPVFPLEKTIVNVNIDMIGRVDDAHEKNPDYIYVIGADKLSSDLHVINEDVNGRFTNLKLDYKYNDENDPNRYYYRSDHYSFAVKGIPAIFYFNGTHADYHLTSDTIEKINFPALAKRTKLAFHTAWELANREERIKVDKK